MNICIDIGNTCVKIAFFKGEKLEKKIILPSVPSSLLVAYENILNSSLISEKIILEKDIKIIISSVVPELTKIFIKLSSSIFKSEPYILDKNFPLPFKIDIDEKVNIGMDLIADLSGAFYKYHYPTLVIDLGTASKFLFLEKDNAFRSCLIVPGIITSFNSLRDKAALIPLVTLRIPTSLKDANNTFSSINTGVVFEHVHMINGFIKQYKDEYGYDFKVVICGGFSTFLKPFFKDKNYFFDENLTLDALNYLLINISKNK